MATSIGLPTASTGTQVVGKVIILHGTVKAVSPDGTVRLLAPNSPIFANDQIITESNGSVSIVMDGVPPTQMDLGRMSNVLIDEDVYAGVTPGVVSDATAEVEQIQQAILTGDSPIDLEATAAGGESGDGGGHPLFVVNLTGEEVTPESGAGTIGVTFTAPSPEESPFGHPVEATPPSVSIGSGITGGSATEGNPVTFTLHQDTVSDHDTTVTVQVVGVPGDSATAGLDYTPITTLDVTILAGQQDATFTVNTLTDQLQEGTETFTAHIVSATNTNGAVTVGTADAVGTILDANVAPLNTATSVDESAMDTVMSGNDLAPSNDIGTNPASLNETATGSLNLQDGWTVVASSGTTSYGNYEIHENGSFVYTLVNAPDVSGASTTDTISYSITNGGVTQTDNTLTVTIVDDTPVLAITNGIFQNSTDTVLHGTLASIGADTNLSLDHLVGSYIDLSTNNGVDSGLTSHGVEVVYHVDAADSSILYAMAENTKVFTLTGNPDGTYSFAQHELLDLSVLTSNLQASVGASGPQPAYYMYTDGSFGSVATKAWSVAITSDPGHTINPSTQGMGVDNNQFSSGETMHFNFDNEGASGAPNLAYQADIGINGLDSGESVSWTAYFTDGSTLSNVAHSSDLVNGHLVITSPSDNVHLDRIDFTAGADTSVRLTSVVAYNADTSITKTLGFDFTATDADGDHVGGHFTLLAQNSAILNGDTSNNALGGGHADNIMTGSAGADIFTASAGHDHITDFSAAQGDKVDISAIFDQSHDTLVLSNDGGHMKLSVMNGTTEKGSITYDHIDYSPAITVDSLLNDGTHHS